MVARGLGDLGVVRRCGKGRGEEGGVGVCMVKKWEVVVESWGRGWGRGWRILFGEKGVLGFT